MGRVVIEFTVANNDDVHLLAHAALPPDQVRRAQLQGVVDTGANYLVLPETVVKQLGLALGQPMMVRFGDGRIEIRDVVEETRVELLGRHGIFRAIVEPGRSDALIGAIVLEDLDLLVDCSKQTLQLRDPNQMLGVVE